MKIKETDRSIITHKIDINKKIDNPKWKIMLKWEGGRECAILLIENLHNLGITLY